MSDLTPERRARIDALLDTPPLAPVCPHCGRQDCQSITPTREAHKCVGERWRHFRDREDYLTEECAASEEEALTAHMDDAITHRRYREALRETREATDRADRMEERAKVAEAARYRSDCDRAKLVERAEKAEANAEARKRGLHESMIREEETAERAEQAENSLAIATAQTLPLADAYQAEHAEVMRLRGLIDHAETVRQRNIGEGHLTVRDACRHRHPLDGTDAQALENALTITERERDTSQTQNENLLEEMERLRGEVTRLDAYNRAQVKAPMTEAK